MSDLGNLTLSLRVNAETMFADLRKASAGVTNEFEKTNKRAAKGMESTVREMQGYIDRISGRKATNELNLIAQAIDGIGGKSKLNADQLARLTTEVNRLAAAGAKVPQSLQGLTGIGSKLGAVAQALGGGGGVTGALAAIGPAGVAAAAGLGVVSVAGGALLKNLKDMGAQAEQWTNIAASTGLGAKEVQQLSTLLEDAGIPAEALTQGFKKMQQEIATGGAGLAKFGIAVSDLKDLSPEEQFRKLADQIAGIQDPATRTAAAIAAFGRSGQELLPVLNDVADGAEKAFHAFSDDEIDQLKEADAAFDQLGRTWRRIAGEAALFTNQVIKGGPLGQAATSLGEAMREQLLGLAPEQPSTRRSASGKSGIFNAPTFGVAGPSSAELEKERQADEARLAAFAKSKKATDEAAAAEKKLAESRAKFAARVQAGISDRMIEEAAGLVTSKDLLSVAPGLKKGGTAAAMVDQFTSSRLSDETVSGKLAAEAKAAEEADKRTQALIGTFGTLANQLTNLSQHVGGFGGKLLGIAASLSSGAGGIFSGISGFKQAGQQSGILGLVGKFSSGLGAIGSAIGVAAGLIGGIKSLFGGKSKEQKAAEEAAKKQAEAAAIQAKVDARQKLEGGLSTARGGAEGLMARLEAGGLSEGLTKAFQALIGKVSDALIKNGLGILDARLSKSEGFTQAQGAAGDVATIIKGMRDAGMIDQGLTQAAGGAAAEIQQQAIEAAHRAGLSDLEAARAGSAAIAQILREQLNSSIQSGRELDENTQRLLEEARKNGIEILADPAIESLGVQRQQLDVLKRIAGMPAGGGGGGGGGGDTGGVGGGGGGGDTGGGGGDEGDGGGRGPWDRKIPQMAKGGFVNAPRTGMPAMLHGPELVLPLNAARLSSALGGGPAGAGSDNAELLAELRMLRADYAEMPRRMANAVRVAVALS